MYADEFAKIAQGSQFRRDRQLRHNRRSSDDGGSLNLTERPGESIADHQITGVDDKQATCPHKCSMLCHTSLLNSSPLGQNG